MSRIAKTEIHEGTVQVAGEFYASLQLVIQESERRLLVRRRFSAAEPVVAGADIEEYLRSVICTCQQLLQIAEEVAPHAAEPAPLERIA